MVKGVSIYVAPLRFALGGGGPWRTAPWCLLALTPAFSSLVGEPPRPAVFAGIVSHRDTMLRTPALCLLGALWGRLCTGVLLQQCRETHEETAFIRISQRDLHLPTL
jgi:hypothetical protein